MPVKNIYFLEVCVAGLYVCTIFQEANFQLFVKVELAM